MSSPSRLVEIGLRFKLDPNGLKAVLTFLAPMIFDHIRALVPNVDTMPEDRVNVEVSSYTFNLLSMLCARHDYREAIHRLVYNRDGMYELLRHPRYVISAKIDDVTSRRDLKEINFRCSDGQIAFSRGSELLEVQQSSVVLKISAVGWFSDLTVRLTTRCTLGSTYMPVCEGRETEKTVEYIMRTYATGVNFPSTMISAHTNREIHVASILSQRLLHPMTATVTKSNIGRQTHEIDVIPIIYRSPLSYSEGRGILMECVMPVSITCALGILLSDLISLFITYLRGDLSSTGPGAKTEVRYIGGRFEDSTFIRALKWRAITMCKNVSDVEFEDLEPYGDAKCLIWVFSAVMTRDSRPGDMTHGMVQLLHDTNGLFDTTRTDAETYMPYVLKSLVVVSKLLAPYMLTLRAPSDVTVQEEQVLERSSMLDLFKGGTLTSNRIYDHIRATIATDQKDGAQYTGGDGTLAYNAILSILGEEQE